MYNRQYKHPLTDHTSICQQFICRHFL